MQYRDVLNVIQFLIDHIVFVENMTYQSIRCWNTETQSRIYNEFHIEQWWWRTQTKLSSNVTVVSILLFSDKIILTRMHDDKFVYSIYMTIDNLNVAIRLSQIRSKVMQLEFLLIVKSIIIVKYEIYHRTMKRILKRESNDWSWVFHWADDNLYLALKSQALKSIEMLCADEYHRLCHSIIARFKIDYEKQMLITDVKSQVHCTTCTISSSRRHDLMIKWSSRTHEYTKTQIERQQREKTKKTHLDWIHSVKNFAWKHDLLNIHEEMMMNILHELHSHDIVNHLVKWIRKMLEVRLLKTKRNRDDSVHLMKSSTSQLDRRFQLVSSYVDLKHFNNFSEVTQWIENEQKFIMHQLISMLASLLTSISLTVMKCVRAIMNFAILTHYRTHDEDTLFYMNNVLTRISLLKDVFRKYRFRKNTNQTEYNEKHFNFFKWHALQHCVEHIRKFDNLINNSTEKNENMHKDIKSDYSRINKHEDYQEQLLYHNTRKMNMMTMNDLLLYTNTIKSNSTEHDLNMKTISVFKSRELSLSDWSLDREKKSQIKRVEDISRHHRKTKMFAQRLQLNDLMNHIFVYIQECRASADEISLTQIDENVHMTDWKNSNSSSVWVEDCLISHHSFISCWKRIDKIANTQNLSREYVRCFYVWESKQDSLRQDWVWVQKYISIAQEQVQDRSNKERLNSCVEETLIEQLLTIFTIIDSDSDRCDDQNRRNCYQDALVKTLKWRNQDISDEIHDMIKIERISSSKRQDDSNARARRLWSLSIIKRSVHVIFIDENDKRFYINNYVNWEIYNTFYRADWAKLSIRRVRKTAKQMKSEKTRDRQKIVVDAEKRRDRVVEANANDQE